MKTTIAFKRFIRNNPKQTRMFVFYRHGDKLRFLNGHLTNYEWLGSHKY